MVNRDLGVADAAEEERASVADVGAVQRLVNAEDRRGDGAADVAEVNVVAVLQLPQDVLVQGGEGRRQAGLGRRPFRCKDGADLVGEELEVWRKLGRKLF